MVAEAALIGAAWQHRTAVAREGPKESDRAAAWAEPVAQGRRTRGAAEPASMEREGSTARSAQRAAWARPAPVVPETGWVARSLRRRMLHPGALPLAAAGWADAVTVRGASIAPWSQALFLL